MKKLTSVFFLFLALSSPAPAVDSPLDSSGTRGGGRTQAAEFGAIASEILKGVQALKNPSVEGFTVDGTRLEEDLKALKILPHSGPIKIGDFSFDAKNDRAAREIYFDYIGWDGKSPAAKRQIVAHELFGYSFPEISDLNYAYSRSLVALLASKYAGPNSRDYRIFSAAGNFGLAWGCKGRKVDFEKLDIDPDYEEAVMEACQIRHYLLNLYEDRIVDIQEDMDFYSVRSHDNGHHSVGLESRGELDPGPAESLSLYTIWSGWKWAGGDELFFAQRDSGEKNDRVVFCRDCLPRAAEAAYQKLGWSAELLQHYAISHRVEGQVEAGSRAVVVAIEGTVPKRTGDFSIKARYRVVFSADGEPSLELMEILSAEKTDPQDDREE